MSAAHLLGFVLALQVPEPPAADDLLWSVPAGCPDRDALLAGIARRRGKPLEPGQARVVARAHLQGPQRYRLDLELEVAGRRDTRVLHARTCTALVDGVALVVALAVDGDPGTPPAPAPDPGAPEPSEPEALAEPAPEPAPVAPEVVPAPAVPDALPPEPALPGAAADAPPAASPPAPRSRWRPGGFLRLHGLGEVGALPGPSGGVGLAGGLLWRWFRLELHAGYLAPRLFDHPDLRARVSLFTFGALGCARLGRGRLEVPICLGLEAGGLPAVADTGRVVIGRWLAAGGGLGAAVRVHPRVALWAFLHGLAAFQRGTLALRQPGPDGDLRVLYDPGLASARLALGVEVKFGDPR
ncbi:hypothetical protein [Nannocystis punicea]|uniref:Uncharacterized protein n=1 Tax=Nannocystis punicea TaxID=2995304 RepID=A0ABY7HJI8_9BACT|nr:hypothetical protein [Nannocystis poenicansa]WAS99212.1 hypothetical protein O0S08_24045 [Nannocystis poenicansa]